MLITQDAAEAEEAAQDAFVKAWRALRALPRRRAAAPVAADDRRQRGAQPAPLGRPAPALALRASCPTEARPLGRGAVLAASRARALLAALARLRDDDRLVLGCRYLLELSEAETAAALGVKPGTVKSRTSRALERLRGEVTP